jgi:hypothetical protein
MLHIRIAWDHPARPPDGTTEHVLLIGLTPPAGLATLPGNFCILLDCSGSMEGDKLHNAKAACRLAARSLKLNDLLSLITFNSRPTVRFTAERREKLTDLALEAVLDRLKAEGTTNTDAGLAEAKKALHPHLSPARVSTLLLITDGYPTDAKGGKLTEYDSLYAAADRLAEAGISLVTVGLGSAKDYHSAFLAALAERGRGRFCYAPEVAQLVRLLHEQIQMAQATVVSGLQIALKPLMGGVRLTGFCRITPEFLPLDVPAQGPDRAWHFSCGTLEAEVAEAETLFLTRLEVPSRFGLSQGEHAVMSASASWQLSSGKRQASSEITAALKYTRAPEELAQVNEQAKNMRLRWEMNLYQAELGQSQQETPVTVSPTRTAEVLRHISGRAGQLGLEDIVKQVTAHLEQLTRTGRLDPDHVTHLSQHIRKVGRSSASPAT